MGHYTKTSVLNQYNQVHEVPNTFITDGSCSIQPLPESFFNLLMRATFSALFSTLRPPIYIGAGKLDAVPTLRQAQ